MGTIVQTSLLNPAVLFFVLGLVAVAIRSDLDLPSPLPKVLALYLLLSIGFRGGVELTRSGAAHEVAPTLLASFGMALVVPLYAFFWLRRRLDAANAAALAASYGSVSAVTFVTAAGLLKSSDIPYGGHMVAALALMESPAIVVGLLLARRQEKTAAGTSPLAHTLREAAVNGTVVLLLGSLAIGFFTADRDEQALKPFTGDLFQGALCLFLLDLGIVAGQRIRAMAAATRWLVGFAIAVPLINASLALGIAALLRMEAGNAFLFCVLCASASYIAVPAAMRHALPQADPALYVTAAIALTFPFNVLVGMPLYLATVVHFWS